MPVFIVNYSSADNTWTSESLCNILVRTSLQHVKHMNEAV